MDFHLPPVGEGLYEVELIRWLVRPGDAIAHGQGLAEVMSDKATMEVPSPFSGTVTALSATPGAKIAVGQAVLTYTPNGAIEEKTSDSHDASDSHEASGPNEASGRRKPAVQSQLVQPQDQPTHNGTATLALPPAAPSVRLLARKFGIDLARVHGSGPHGRILLDDLTPLLQPSAPTSAEPVRPEPPKPDYGKPGTTVKLLGLRRKIAEHMLASTRHIPHYSYIDECDATDLVKLRTQLREPFGQAGVKLTYLAFFVKAVARALKEIPIVNSTFDEAAGEIKLLDRYHVGIATATPGGLIVPVVKDADKKDVAAIARDIDRLSTEAKAGHSRLEDLKGGTFTVTSIGNIGGLISTPIINHPEVGIMGVGKIVKRPAFDAHGQIRAAEMLYLSFSFDHRILDGAIGAAFGNAVIHQLQHPATLLLPEKLGG